MKKYFYLLLTIILFTPMIVLGDVSGPNILGYDAVVINPSGSKDIYGDRVIPYNSKVRVYDETDDIVQVCVDDFDSCRGGIALSLKDIKPLKDEVIPTGNDAKGVDSFIAVYNKNIIIYNKNGAKLSKGPADIYAKYDNTIPNMTILKAQYYVSSFREGGYAYYPWFYVNEGKYKGWVKVEDIGYTIEDRMLFTDLKMIDENGKTILTIPKGTILKGLYKLPIAISFSHYLEYNGKKGYIMLNSTGFLNKGLVLAKKDTKLYDSNNKELATIKSGDTADVLYAQSDSRGPDLTSVYVDDNHSYYYVQYNGKKGFVNGNDVIGISEYDLDKKTLEIKNDTTLYNFDEWGDFNNKKIGTIKKSEVVNSYRTLYNGEFNYYLIVKNGKIGYVSSEDSVVTNKKVTDNNVIDNNSTNDNDTKTSDDNQEVNNNNNTTDDNNLDNQNNENNNTINETKPSVQKKSNDTLIFAILGAVIVSLVAVIIVLLVNKNKGANSVVSTDVKKDNTNIEINSEQEPIKLNNEKDMEKKD